MDIKIYDEEKKEKKEEKTVRIRLMDDCGDIQLQAVDKFGDRVSGGTLFEFNSDGTISRAHSVEPDIGFKLDCEGRIEFDGDD